MPDRRCTWQDKAGALCDDSYRCEPGSATCGYLGGPCEAESIERGEK
jgi:hypothetical protein